LLKKKVALSACLLGCSCRYDAKNNLNQNLLSQLSAYEIIPFCPEDDAFGTPRATIDLIDDSFVVKAISNKNFNDLSKPIVDYAQNFFQEYSDVKLFIGKDRSPSCGVKSAKVYDCNKTLLHETGTGLMAKVALDLNIESWDAKTYELNHTS
jgi:uncharacterized protein YbbK (DUF523 family)